MFCASVPCQEAYKKYKQNTTTKRVERKEFKNVRIKNRKANKRKCLVCKRFCAPNYFYCKDCHKIVSRAHGFDEETYGGQII